MEVLFYYGAIECDLYLRWRKELWVLCLSCDAHAVEAQADVRHRTDASTPGTYAAPIILAKGDGF
jgi:hypothetical protein